MRIPALLLTLLLSTHTSTLANTIYVDRTAPAPGDGLTWATAFPSLQSALIAAAPADEIRIAAGAYTPGPAGSPTSITFTIPASLTLRGSYAGRASPTPDARNIIGTPTILSGDLSGNDTGATGNRADNAIHLVTSAALGSTLDGLTLTHSPSGGTGGGGLLITAGDLHVVDCIFSVNGLSANGGGCAVLAGSPRFDRCTFRNNQTGQFGGGLYTAGSGAPVIADCLFEANIGGEGGGLCNRGPCAPLIQRCTFRLNRGDISIGQGPGSADYNGPSPANAPGQAVFEDCLFDSNNTGSGGGGLFVINSNTIARRCRFIKNVGSFDGGGALFVTGGSPVIDACIFTGNVTSASGHAIYLDSHSSATVINCTIANNGALTPPLSNTGAVRVDAAANKLYNCIIWNNRDTSGAGFTAQIRSFGTFFISHSIIAGWTGGPDNSPADPLFASLAGPDAITGTADDDFHLLPNSPAIDAGLNSVLPAGNDLDGSTRPLGAAVDIGAYERHSPADLGSQGGIPGADGLLDNNDFVVFIDLFFLNDHRADLGIQGGIPGADGLFDNNDFVVFIGLFFGP